MDSANTSSSSFSSGLKRKRSIGRQKIAIEAIQNESARQVCFSKRRKGLFKKAEELCGTHIKIVIFSPAGKPYSFIQSTDSVNLSCHVSHPNRLSEQDQRIQLSEFEILMNAAKKRKSVLLKGLRDADMARDDVSQDELDAREMHVKAALALKMNELSTLPYLEPAQEPTTVLNQDGYGHGGFDSELISLDDYKSLDELSILSYLVPLQEPVPVPNQDGCGTCAFDAELFCLDDFNFGGGVGLLC